MVGMWVIDAFVGEVVDLVVRVEDGLMDQWQLFVKYE